MPFDEIVQNAISRLGVVRVSNALNPLLYVTLVVMPISWACAWLFQDDLTLKYGLIGFGALFPLAFLVHYTRFSLKDPDRLQSEEYLARKQELSVIERKGARGPAIIPPTANDRLLLEQDLPPNEHGKEGK